MTIDLSGLPARAVSWNKALAARPGDIDHHVPSHQVEGEVPASLRGGRLLSNGPGWNVFGDRIAHPFDGHGYVRSLAFGTDGSVALKARFVRTEVFVSEQAHGSFVHRGLATNAHDPFWKNLRLGTARNVANTTVYRWNGRLLAGWEAGSPHAMDPVTLDTLGPETFGGLVQGKVTLAHMHRDERRGRLILCNTAAGRNTKVTFHELDREDNHVQTRTGELSGGAFAHDFMFTDRWYLLGGNPLSVRPGRLAKALLGAGTLLPAMKANTTRPGELVLIPRDEQGPTRRVRLPGPAFVVHFSNAFERGGDVVVDACIFHDFTFGEEFGYTGPRTPFDPSLPEVRGAQSFYRITIPEGADEATWEKLVPHGVDFPRIHPDHEGRDTPYMVGACRADTRFSDPFDSILRVDLTAPGSEPVLWTAEDDVFVGEPVIAPGRDGEPDHVLVILSDGQRERSTLAILRADDLAAGPVARVRLPLLPVAFHGDWDPVGVG